MAEQALVYKEMTIEEIFSTFPQYSQSLAHEMSNAGLHCVGCHAATWETLEAGVLGHGMSQETLEELLGKLNRVVNQKLEQTGIELTSRAAEKYLQILADENKTGWGVRLAEKLAGCDGYEFILDFSEEATDNDQVFESKGIQIHVAKDILSHVEGSVISFVEGLNQSGFKVTNPHVKSSCSCGTSHGY